MRRLEPFRKRSFAAAEQEEQKGEEELSEKQQEAQEKLLEGLELGQMQEAVNELLGEETFNIRESLAFVLKEGRLFSKEGVKEIGKAFLKSHLSVQKQTVVQILLLVLAASLFSNFANAFGKGQTGEVSFYVVYLLLLVLLIHTFGSMGEELSKSLQGFVLFMKALIPSYFWQSLPLQVLPAPWCFTKPCCWSFIWYRPCC